MRDVPATEALSVSRLLVTMATWRQLSLTMPCLLLLLFHWVKAFACLPLYHIVSLGICESVSWVCNQHSMRNPTKHNYHQVSPTAFPAFTVLPPRGTCASLHSTDEKTENQRSILTKIASQGDGMRKLLVTQIFLVPNCLFFYLHMPWTYTVV